MGPYLGTLLKVGFGCHAVVISQMLCPRLFAQIPLIMIFADVAKGVAKEALAENIRTMAAVFSFLVCRDWHV